MATAQAVMFVSVYLVNCIIYSNAIEAILSSNMEQFGSQPLSEVVTKLSDVALIGLLAFKDCLPTAYPSYNT